MAYFVDASDAGRHCSLVCLGGCGMKNKALDIIEDHIVRISQENLPMPAYLQAEMMLEALERGCVFPMSWSGDALNDQEAGQAASDRQPPTESPQHSPGEE